MNEKREKLINDVIDDLAYIQQKTGIRILELPDEELDRWVQYLVKINSKSNK